MKSWPVLSGGSGALRLIATCLECVETNIITALSSVCMSTTNTTSSGIRNASSLGCSIFRQQGRREDEGQEGKEKGWKEGEEEQVL